MSAPAGGWVAWLDRTARWAMAALLVTSGAIHIELSPNFQHMPGPITVGALFYVQGVACFAVACALILSSLVEPVLFAGAVAGVSLLAVVQSVYVQEQRPGFFPVLYEPSWYFQKSLTAVAEGAVVLLALGVLAVRRLRRGHPQVAPAVAVEMPLVARVPGGLVLPRQRVMLPPAIPAQRAASPVEGRQRIRT